MASKREQRLSELLAKNALDLIMVLDDEGIVEYASPSLRRLLGYLPEDFIGKSAVSFINQGDVPRVLDFLSNKVNSHEISEKIDFWARHDDGSYRFLEAIGTRLPDHTLNSSIMISVRDITDRRQAQEILGGISMVFLNLGANPLKNIRLLVNDGKDILGTDFSFYCRSHRGRMSLISASDDEELELQDGGGGSICRDIITGKVASPLILGDLDDTGYERSDPFAVAHGFKACAAHSVTFEGTIVGCMCAYYAKKRRFAPYEIAVMELGVKAVSIEEERAAHEDGLKDLTDIVSHELRHPITILKGYAGFMRESWSSLDDVKRAEILQIIENSADRLESLVNDFLDVSRMERSMFAIHKEEVDLSSLVKKAIDEMCNKGFGNDFVVSLPEEDRMIDGDPEKLVQLLIILLENALKYSPGSSVVELRAERKNGHMEVAVLDRGAGICDEDRERIFERFFQSEEARNHSKSGIGLGLYIARKIVDAHGGRIWCEPRQDGGSAFRFILP